MAFKIFETFNKYNKQYSKITAKLLREADGDDTDEETDDTTDTEGGLDDAGLGAGEGDATMPEGGESDPNDPSIQADPETGVFMSDNQKADFAKTMLGALMAQPPAAGTIPANLMNVTTQNADDVIKYIQSLTKLTNNTSDTDDSIKGSMADEIKKVGNF